MRLKVLMPRLGAEMTKGTIIEWFKKEGDQVNLGEPLFLVNTEKAEIEVEAEISGILTEILVPDAEQEVPVGETIAIIETQ